MGAVQQEVDVLEAGPAAAAPLKGPSLADGQLVVFVGVIGLWREEVCVSLHCALSLRSSTHYRTFCVVESLQRAEMSRHTSLKSLDDAKLGDLPLKGHIAVR